MNRERMEHLLQTMRDVAARDAAQEHTHFDMDSWCARGAETDDSGRPIVNCHTSACALGWEALTPYAQERGLALQQETGCSMFSPRFNSSQGFDAGKQYFELENMNTAYALFDPDYYTGSACREVEPHDVIERIQYLMRVGESKLVETFNRHLTYSSGAGYEAASYLPGGANAPR